MSRQRTSSCDQLIAATGALCRPTLFVCEKEGSKAFSNYRSERNLAQLVGQVDVVATRRRTTEFEYVQESGKLCKIGHDIITSFAIY